jgi:hypothetical protein
VTIDEILRGVGIVQGVVQLTECPAFDADGNGNVAVNEVVLAVNHALGGCPVAAATP